MARIAGFVEEIEDSLEKDPRTKKQEPNKLKILNSASSITSVREKQFMKRKRELLTLFFGLV